MNTPLTNPPEVRLEFEELRRCPQCNQEQSPEVFDNNSRECPCYSCERTNAAILKNMDATILYYGFDQMIQIGKSWRHVIGTVYADSQCVVRHAVVHRGERSRDIRWYPRNVRAEIEIAILEAV